jgi:hypothetical protein
MISVSAVCIRYATGFGSSAVVARDLEVHLRRVEVAEDSFVRANGRDQAFALDRVFAQRDVGTIVMVTSLAAPVGDASANRTQRWSLRPAQIPFRTAHASTSSRESPCSLLALSQTTKRGCSLARGGSRFSREAA